MSQTSLSLTRYYQLFELYLNTLESTGLDVEISKKITVARQLIAKGMALEKQENPFTMKAMAEEIAEIALTLGLETEIFCNGRTKKYGIPTINSLAELLFAILYLKHLQTYQNVFYGGSITTYMFVDAKTKIEEGIATKKPWLKSQALYLESEIKKYCIKHNINYDESIKSPLLSSDSEEVLSEIFTSLIPQNTTLLNSVDLLEQQQQQRRDKYLDSLGAFKHFSKSFFKYQQAQQDLAQLNKCFYSKNKFRQLVSWLMDKIYPIDQDLQNLKKAQKKSDKAFAVMTELCPANMTHDLYLEKLFNEQQIAEQKYHQALTEFTEASQPMPKPTYSSNDSSLKENNEDKVWHKKQPQQRKPLVKKLPSTQPKSLTSPQATTSYFFKPSPKTVAISASMIALGVAASYTMMP